MYTIDEIKALARTGTIANGQTSYVQVGYGNWQRITQPAGGRTQGATVTIGTYAISCHYIGGAFHWYIGERLVAEADIQALINRHSWIPPEAGYDLGSER